MTKMQSRRLPDFSELMRESVRHHRRDVTSSTILAVGHQLSEAAVPVVVGVALDRAVGTGNGSALALWLAVVAGVFVVLASCGAVGYWRADRARLRTARELRLRVAVRALDPAGGVPGRSGELVGLASSDANRSAQIVLAYVRAAGFAAALLAGGAVLFAASPVLAAAVLAGIPLVLLISRLLARPLAGKAEAEQAALATATGAATDLVTGLRVIKGIGAEQAAAAAYAKASRRALRARLIAVGSEGRYLGATTAVTGLFLVVVALLGGRLALTGAISIGELVASVGLAQFMLEPLERLTRLAPLVAGARGAAIRVARLLAAPPAVTPGRDRLDTPAGRLQIRHDGLAVDLAAGEHLGLVITDPSRAARLLDVLGRNAEPDGTVAVDGTDLRRVSLDDARRAVLVARHEAVLFEGTLRENIGDGQIDAVLAASAADEVVDAMPDGVDTEIGERGRTLSGGQRQRVALARALAADPAVLVLHDPTTAIDAATEDRVATGLRQYRAGRSTLLVTSSPALLARCDRVLLIADGEVAEGTHSTLVSDPRYRSAVLG